MTTTHFAGSFEGLFGDAGPVLEDDPVVSVESANEGPGDDLPRRDVAPFDPFEGDDERASEHQSERAPFVHFPVLLSRFHLEVIVVGQEEPDGAKGVARGDQNVDPHVDWLEGEHAGPEVEGSVQVEEPDEGGTDVEVVAEAILLLDHSVKI